MSSTLDLEWRKALSIWARHWTWNGGKRCRYELDIGPGMAESAVECDSTLDMQQRRALSSSTPHR